MVSALEAPQVVGAARETPITMTDAEAVEHPIKQCLGADNMDAQQVFQTPSCAVGGRGAVESSGWPWPSSRRRSSPDLSLTSAEAVG